MGRILNQPDENYYIPIEETTMTGPKNITKSDAITAYVLHLMMWDELSKSGDTTKIRTRAINYHKAFTCEFCKINSKANNDDVFGPCLYCPADVSNLQHQKSCLGGMYNEWLNSSSKKERKAIATQIRDIKLAEWFKKLVS